MWTPSLSVVLVAVVDVLVVVVAVPATTQIDNDIAENFQKAMRQQSLHSILSSIEERLRNLDAIYSMHLSPTIEEKFEQYQRKLESIDTKIMRLESLMMLNLDKISENISTKNFKDDIAKTNLMKKMDTVYEGLSHRANYIDRKFESQNIKLQNKIENTITKLEKIEESFSKRNEDLEIGVSDAIAALDDLKSGCQLMEENIVNNTNDNFEVSLKEHMTLMQNFNDKSLQALRILYENASKDFERFDEKFERGLEGLHSTNKSLQQFKLEVKRELNEYAVKVAEMNVENWKTGAILQSKQNKIEAVLNSTKKEMENSIKAVTMLIDKISNVERLPQADQTEIVKLNDDMTKNFEKVFSIQNLFLDSCYRLQMDESQIESKISDILEKLMETFEKKTTIELKDIKNFEKLIKSHESHIVKNFYQANTNIVTIYEKMTEWHSKFENDFKGINDRFDDVMSSIHSMLPDDENISLSTEKINILLQHLDTIERKLTPNTNLTKTTDLRKNQHNNHNNESEIKVGHPDVVISDSVTNRDEFLSEQSDEYDDLETENWPQT